MPFGVRIETVVHRTENTEHKTQNCTGWRRRTGAVMSGWTSAVMGWWSEGHEEPRTALSDLRKAERQTGPFAPCYGLQRGLEVQPSETQTLFVGLFHRKSVRCGCRQTAQTGRQRGRMSLMAAACTDSALRLFSLLLLFSVREARVPIYL